MSQPAAVRRRTELDALRILACFMVIVIHVSSSKWYTMNPASLTWQFTNFCNTAARACLVCFLYISGTNFLREEKPLPVLFKKYILRLFVIFCFWTLLYAVDEIGLRELFATRNIKRLILTCFDEKYHLWYLPKMITAYMVVPLLWCAVRWKDGKYVKYLCCISLVWLFVKSLLTVLPLPEIVPPVLLSFLPSFGTFVGLMLVGYYLSEQSLERVRIWQLLAVFCGTVLLTAAYNGYASYRAGEVKNYLLDNFSFPSIIEGTCLFCLFRKLADAPIFTKHTAFWKNISACTLGIYLIHVFVLEHLELWCGLTVFSLPVPLSLPLLSIGIFLISLAVTALLRRIPVVGKWLV